MSAHAEAAKRGGLRWLARAASLALVLQVTAGGLGYLLQLGWVHWMGTSEFGAYTYATTWATVLSLFTGLGLQSAVVRFIPLYAAATDTGRYAGVIRTGRWLTLAASLVFAALGTLLAWVFRDHLVAGFAPTVLALWLIPSLSLAEFDAAVARAQGRVATAYLPWYVIRPVATFVALGLLLVVGANRNATTALTATLVIFTGAWVIQRVIVDRRSPSDVRAATPTVETRKWLSVALPLLLVSGFQLALTQTDILVVGAIGGRSDAALYSVASKTALLVGYLMLAVTFAAGPLFPPFVDAGKREELQRLVSATTRWVFWSSVAVGLVLAALSPFVLRLFGTDFDAARAPMLILIGSQIINAAFGTVGSLLSYTGYQRDAARAYGGVAALNLALCIVLTKLFSMNGAAAATAVSILVWNMWLRRLTTHRLGIHISIFDRVRKRPTADITNVVRSPSPRVAVVIPCFNDGAFLRQAVSSVTPHDDVELVVVDDGSTDPATRSVLETLAAEGVDVVTQPNAGPAAARRRGAERTTAPYVFPLDADDYVAEGALTTLADHLDADRDLDVVWGDYQYVGERTHVKEVAAELDPWLVSYLNDYPASALFRRATLDRVGAWEPMRFHEDWDLWMRLAEAGCRGAGIGELVYYHRLHGIRRRTSAIPHFEELRGDLRARHPSLFANRNAYRKQSNAPILAKLLLPLTERIPIGRPYRRAFVAAAIWHTAQRRGGYHRPFKRLLVGTNRADGVPQSVRQAST